MTTMRTAAAIGTAYSLPLGRDRSSPPEASGNAAPQSLRVSQKNETAVGLGADELSSWEWVTGPMTDFRPSDRVSFHEAGHLVIGLLRGLTPLVVFASEDGGGVLWKGPIAARQDVTMVLAGPLAEGFFDNWQHRPTDEDLKPWLLAVRRGEKKTDDFGKAFTTLINRCGASDRAVMSAFRSAEVEAIDLLDRRDVRAAVRAIATKLTCAGRLLGADAAELASRHIEPGSLKMENTP